MTSTPIEVGTLIVVILKAKNLPNKRHIGKQDPYCSVKLNNETRRTRAIRRGGQHPEWDEEIRFTIFEDVEDELARTATSGGDEAPPPPPKKDNKKKIKSAKKMQLMCYADDPREPDLIGETMVDLTEVLTKGETDEWFTLTNKEKYCGEVYLELTFWSNEKPPERQTTPKPSAFHPQYGGPGSFTPSTEIPAALKHGSGNQNTPSPSRLSSNGGSDLGLPTSLRPSGSLSKLNLYNAPYEQQNRYGDAVDQLSNGMASLDFDGPLRRRESFPPALSEFGYTGTFSSHHSGSFSTQSSSGSLSSIHSQSSLGGRPYHTNTLSSLPEPFVQDDYSPGHSHVMPPVSGSYHPEPSYSYPHASSGFVAPPPSHTPVPSQLGPTSHPMSSGFASPQPTSSAMGHHPSQPSQQQYTIPSQTPFQPPYPQPLAPARANHYADASLPPSSIPPVPHSAPPQQYVPHGTPSPPHHNQPGLPANAYHQMQASSTPGSRPLPNPQHQSSLGLATPPPGPTQPMGPTGVMFPNAMPFQPPGPPPPPPPRRRSSLPPTPSSTPSVSFTPPPPPPPPPLHNGTPMPQQVTHLSTPPPPPHFSQSYDGQSTSASPHGSQPSLSQLTHPSQGFGNLPPPPPPPSMPNYSGPPHAPLPPSNYSTPPLQLQQPYYPGPPPIPPPQFPVVPSWNPPQPQHEGWH